MHKSKQIVKTLSMFFPKLDCGLQAIETTEHYKYSQSICWGLKKKEGKKEN